MKHIFVLILNQLKFVENQELQDVNLKKRTTTLLLLLDIVRLKIHTIMDISYMQFVVLVVLCIPMILQKLMYMM